MNGEALQHIAKKLKTDKNLSGSMLDRTITWLQTVTDRELVEILRPVFPEEEFEEEHMWSFKVGAIQACLKMQQARQCKN